MAEYEQRGDYGAVNVEGIKNNEIDSGNTDRILPRQLSTGSTRGTQTVGYGSVKIDGSNNRIQLDANTTNITLGDTSDTDNVTGIALTDNISGKKLISLGRDVSIAQGITGLTAYDETETRRLLAGSFPDNSIKIKLSRPGYDVATATDDQLIWSSDFNLFKIVKSGTTDITVPGSPNGTYSASVAHGLATIPAVISYIKDNNGVYLSMPYTALGLGTPNSVPTVIYATIDEMNVNFNITTNTAFAAGTYTIRYYILLETAA